MNLIWQAANAMEMEQAPIVLAVFLGSVVSGALGFAFSAVAGAVLFHFIDPLQAVSLMLACTIASQTTTLATLRKHINWSESLPMIAGGILGAPAGVYLLHHR